MGLLKKNCLALTIAISLLNFNTLNSDERVGAIIDQLQIISQDLKTLESAFYKKSDVIDKNKSSTNNNLNEDVLTKHLLRLNEIEDQFRALTNKFEEINFKMDKLSNRVTKIQSDTQLRFSDLENVDQSQNDKKKKAKLPGSSKPQDFGANPGYSVKDLPQEQETVSVGTTAAVTESVIIFVKLYVRAC